MDIHKGRGNANKVMNRLLYKTGEPFGMRIASIDGGSLRNAIPRESVAVITIPEEHLNAFTEELEGRKQAILEEFKRIEPGMSIEQSEVAMPGKVMDFADQEKALSALYADRMPRNPTIS